jgi:putative ABC transport system permease protein
MKTPLVLLNLRHHATRTAVASAGVGFAVVLAFLQLGFYGSAEGAATSLLEHLDFDIALTASDYLHLGRPRSFARGRLDQVRAHPAVAAATPLYLGPATWRVQEGPVVRRSLLVAGCDPDEPMLKPEAFAGGDGPAVLGRLREPDTVLMDTMTRSYFGRRGPGVETELDYTRVRVVGEVTVGAGYGADGLVFTSSRTFAHVFGSAAPQRVNLGLVRLHPDQRDNPAAVKAALARDLYPPHDAVRVLTRSELLEQERDYWVRRNAVGVIFLLGVVVACVVGVLFVYQVIAADVASQVKEYATLKAMGYPQRYLSGVVLRQALAVAVLGYVPGLAAALGLYALARAGAQVPVAMSLGRAAGVFVLAVAMCGLSGLLALHKVRAADPADLF